MSTAIDAYEFPKLIPTTVGIAETSIGASAVPFGLVDIFVGFSHREVVSRAWKKRSWANFALPPPCCYSD